MSELTKNAKRIQKGISLHPLIIKKINQLAIDQTRSFSNMVEISLAEYFQIDLTNVSQENELVKT